MKSEQSLSKLPANKGFLVGLMLFSMFFGAGNLIIAPDIGFSAQSASPVVMLGFLTTAVGLPVLAIMSVSKAGSFKELTSRVSKRFSLFFMTVIFLSIGPFLALPRSGATAFDMLLPIVPDEHQLTATVVFSVLFFSTAFLLALRPNKLSEFIGKISGPALLVLIVVLIGALVVNPPSYSLGAPSEEYAQVPFISGFVKGYLTMDVLAALVYGITVCLNIKELGVTKTNSVLKQLFKSGLIAGALLAVIYIGFAYLGLVVHGLDSSLVASGAYIISVACAYEFGMLGVLLAASIFIIACLNVAISLITSISIYFSETFPVANYKQWAFIFTVFSAVVSNVGLSAILKYSVPVLCAIYPVSICLVCMGLFQKHTNHNAIMWRFVVCVCSVVSTFYAFRASFFPEAFPFLNQMPLVDYSLEWLMPSVLAGVVGFCIQKFVVKKPAE